MADLEFQRETAIRAVTDNWHDSEAFANLSAQILYMPSFASAVCTLPENDNTGTAALTGALTYAGETMADVIAEFSDACGVLGSGAEDSFKNFDETEFAAQQRFVPLMMANAVADIAARMEG